jgi:hypothetical protein
VNHLPARFGFCPDGREPARAVGSAGAGKNVFSGHERVFFAEHPDDDRFVSKILNRPSRFPEAFLHRLFDGLDAAGRAGREHFGRFPDVRRKVLIQIAFVPAFGRHVERRANRFFILARLLPERDAGANRHYKNTQ